MSVKPWNDTMQHAIAEVEARILALYPEATFRLMEGENPIGLYLDVYTDAIDRLFIHSSGPWKGRKALCATDSVSANE